MVGLFETYSRITAIIVLVFAGTFSSSLSADLLDDIIERGTLRIGVSLFIPYTMQGKSGKLAGFEIEVGKSLAKDLGVKPEFIVYNWEDTIPALRKGDIDIILGGMAITPERALKVNFSQPYSDSGIGLATNTRMTRAVTRLGELNDEKYTIAVVSETVSFAFAKNLFDKANIKSFKTSEEAGKAVVSGDADAFVASIPQPKFLALRHPADVDSPLSKPLIPYKTGMGVKKGEQEWLNFLNSWITAKLADKWLSVTYKYWFEGIEWMKSKDK